MITDDPLLPDAQLRRLVGNVSSMTIWRWRKAGILPPPLVIRGRNYSHKSAIDAALARAIGLDDSAANSLTA